MKPTDQNNSADRLEPFDTEDKGRFVIAADREHKGEITESNWFSLWQAKLERNRLDPVLSDSLTK